MHHFVVTARLRRGAFEPVREILRAGPPFDLADTSLERRQSLAGQVASPGT